MVPQSRDISDIEVAPVAGSRKHACREGHVAPRSDHDIRCGPTDLWRTLAGTQAIVRAVLGSWPGWRGGACGRCAWQELQPTDNQQRSVLGWIRFSVTMPFQVVSPISAAVTP